MARRKDVWNRQWILNTLRIKRGRKRETERGRSDTERNCMTNIVREDIAPSIEDLVFVLIVKKKNILHEIARLHRSKAVARKWEEMG